MKFGRSWGLTIIIVANYLLTGMILQVFQKERRKMPSKPSFLRGPLLWLFRALKFGTPQVSGGNGWRTQKKPLLYKQLHSPPQTKSSNIWFLRWKKNDISRLCQSLVHDLVAKISYAPPPHGLVPCLRSNNSWIDPRKSHQKNAQTLTGSKHCPEKHGCDQMTLARVGFVGEKILQKSICSNHPNI